ncbi:MAG: hypothetical protein CMJ19_15195 [Phycisphaeraceae bacterium]|nr:hypothetical protein [Phycisphaeraceae bacterium]
MIQANQPESTKITDGQFADALLPLVIASFEHAGYPGGEIHAFNNRIVLTAVQPGKPPIRVVIGRTKNAKDQRPNCHRWAIPNSLTWRQSLRHLQTKLFKGRIPDILDPENFTIKGI